MFCPQCGARASEDHRFCAVCGTALPRDVLPGSGPKVTRWFRGLPVGADASGMALRVSRYLEEIEVRAPEGSARIPSHHVRFSIWEGDQAMTAVSIPDDDAEALARFLLAMVMQEGDPPHGGPMGRPADSAR
jgi:hypothetical protein